MTPGSIRSQIVLEKAAYIRTVLGELRALPLSDLGEFLADSRTPAAAESYLRRALEGLLDLCRHVLTKGFAEGALEYKQMASRLAANAVISEDAEARLVRMAGYRNRMVHFYDEISAEELYRICTTDSGDVERVLEEILAWLRTHPDRLDRTL
jgi:uncharacterized protein YutE (UPF0331/DUF86 family)